MIRFKAFGRLFSVMTEQEYLQEGQTIYEYGCQDGGSMYKEVSKERDDLRADAERYRWLRIKDPADPCFMCGSEVGRVQIGWDLDNSIDLELKKK